MDIILYSTHCPQCDILEEKLNAKNIKYTEVSDISLMLEKGIKNVPVLEVDGDMMDFLKACEWVKKQ